MYLANPYGRLPRTKNEAVTIRVGEGKAVHMMNPQTGLPLCMKPAVDNRARNQGRARRENVFETYAEKVSCMRCIKLMAINRRLRSDDLAVGDAQGL
jgi:hypothetical protein